MTITLPVVRLAAPESFDDESAYLDAKRDDMQQRISQADDASDLIEACRHRLAAANIGLSFLVEPAASQILMHIKQTLQPSEEGRLRQDLTEASGQLQKAEKTLTDAKSDDDETKAKLAKLRRSLETLLAFREALQAFFFENGNTSESKSAIRQAASALSGLLEDPDARIVASATLWQAVLRERTNEPQRVLQLLKPALATVASDSRPAFYSRLLYCHLLATAGDYLSSVTLLTQLQPLCEQWFADEKARAEAVRATAWTEVQVLAAWHRHLATTDEAAKTWCVERVRKLVAAELGPDTNTVLRLARAVPDVVPKD